jgi:hypothetical protein
MWMCSIDPFGILCDCYLHIIQSFWINKNTHYLLAMEKFFILISLTKYDEKQMVFRSFIVTHSKYQFKKYGLLWANINPHRYFSSHILMVIIQFFCICLKTSFFFDYFITLTHRFLIHFVNHEKHTIQMVSKRISFCLWS